MCVCVKTHVYVHVVNYTTFIRGNICILQPHACKNQCACIYFILDVYVRVSRTNWESHPRPKLSQDQAQELVENRLWCPRMAKVNANRCILHRQGRKHLMNHLRIKMVGSPAVF